MRKAQALVFALMLGVVAFMAAPVFAGYEATDVMLDQADHSTFAPNWIAIGLLADENRQYGVGTIAIPYANLTYTWPGCTPIVDSNGVPIPGTYQCANDTTNASVDADLILQDVFGMLTEGTVLKQPGQQGIAQYLDSLFDWVGNGAGAVATQYLDQTLDQDLADLTAGSPAIYGIWQRLHTTFDRVYAATPFLDADGMDQTVEAFLHEEGGASWNGGPLAGEVISYMGQWFQKGTDHRCGDVGTSCTHNEFGGHGTVTSTTYTPNVTQHDP